MSSDTAAIVIASISGTVSIGAASIAALAQRRLSEWQAEQSRKLEEQRSDQAKQLEKLRSEQAQELEDLRDRLSRARDAEAQAEQARRVVSKYRDPLLQSAFDLQSRIYNICRAGGFRGRADPEYFRLNTLFVLAEFLGWLEIIRRDLQFLDLSAVDATNELGRKLDWVQDRLASTSRLRDDLFVLSRPPASDRRADADPGRRGHLHRAPA